MRQVFITFGLLFLCDALALGQPNCVLRKDADGIKVYACHSDTTKIKSLKAVFEINVTREQVIGAILDVEGYNHWQYHTVNAHVLEKKSERELIYYTEIVAPWPASNRDLIVHLTYDDNAVLGQIVVNAHSMPDYMPPKKGIVRVPMSRSQWVIKSVGKSKQSVEFTMLVDPGGSVPLWLINLVAAEAPYESFNSLKKRMEPLLGK